MGLASHIINKQANVHAQTWQEMYSFCRYPLNFQMKPPQSHIIVVFSEFGKQTNCI